MSKATIWIDLLAIALGGAGGALLRYGLTLSLPVVFGGRAAVGTWVANMLGCFLLGGLAAWTLAEQHPWSDRQLLLIRVGLLGSLTTFSTFAGEAYFLGQAARGAAAIHLAVHVGVGLIAFAGGHWLAKEYML